jgi:zeaxanthin glucosyltransferase
VKIGFVSFPVVGHLNPMTALARRLQARGNEVVFIGVPDDEATVRAANLNFVSYCEKEYPLGSMPKVWAGAAKLHGLEPIRYASHALTPGLFRAASQHLSKTLAEQGVDALVLDISHSFLQLVPMSLEMPYVQIWNILNVDYSGRTPACFFSWPYETTPEALARNINGLQTIGSWYTSLQGSARAYAEKNGLDIDWNNPSFTELAVISQTPKEFDFPNIDWPENFHYAGPFHDGAGREQVPFPWEELNGKSLIYASLGTLVNGLESIYRSILDAVATLPDVQVVLSIGNNLNPDDLGTIPTNTIVVRRAPQIELLKRAALCITHGGHNTALESLAQGVPMVAIPIAFDQPGVAARIAYHGVGEFTEIEDLSVEKLSKLIRTVLENPSYRDRARHFQEVIAQTQGLDVAADIIEHAFGIAPDSVPNTSANCPAFW